MPLPPESPMPRAAAVAPGRERTGGDGQATTIDQVFEAILKDIVGGIYSAGARLPAERDLARQLGASRPTLREALRRLSEWRITETRRGSGVAVLPKREWSIEVLPSYIKFARPGPGETTVARLLIDLLELRRRLARDIVSIVAGRLPAGSTDAARTLAERAWRERANAAAFTRADFLVMRSLVEAAGFLPAVWLLNRLSTVYFDLADAVVAQFAPPSDYLESQELLFAALDAGNGSAAGEIIDGYLLRHDQPLLLTLEKIS